MARRAVIYIRTSSETQGEKSSPIGQEEVFLLNKQIVNAVLAEVRMDENREIQVKLYPAGGSKASCLGVFKSSRERRLTVPYSIQEVIMYEWTQPYENTYIKQRIEEICRAQKVAREHGRAMEARALALMGQKMKAAQLFYRDEVSRAIVHVDDSDILIKLAREALKAADLPDLQSLFADEVIVSNLPLVSPTASSVHLPVLETPRVVS